MWKAHTSGGGRSYVVALADGTMTLLPQWMTEPAAATGAVVVARPHVSVAALEQLRRLVDAVRQPVDCLPHPPSSPSPPPGSLNV